MRTLTIIGTFLAATFLTSAAIPAQPKSTTPGPGAMATCEQMMNGQGITDEGKKAMREFMQSDRAPQAMANMMAMARRMGDGDIMLGMTRMMEMMGSMGGGMMGGPGGMMQPGRRPGE